MQMFNYSVFSGPIRSVAEAKIAIKELKLKKKEYALVKKDISRKQKEIRAEYTEQVRQRGSKFIGGGGVGRVVRAVQTISRDTDRCALADELAPLEMHKIKVEEAINSIDQKILRIKRYVSENKTKSNPISMKKEDLPAISNSIANNADIYADNVILNAERGHGFAAEKANHLRDVMVGKNAKLVGGDNAKNGADRLVDGIQIQTKYCNSGSKCIQECFHDGQFRYWNADGSPMQIEVPSDSYDAAIKAMEERIKKGQVKGVTDPSQAKAIVRQGQFTYAQARNIAKFGTIESITYDAVNGIRVAGTAMGISAVISFAHAIWNGKSMNIAIEQACFSGIKVGGVTWVSSILMAQIGRTGVEQTLRPMTDSVVRTMGTQTASWIATGLRGGRAIYGAAAMSNVSKLLRGNVVTGVVTTLVLSSGDVTRLIRGRMSGEQFAKNVTTTAAGVAGGAGGYAIGAGIGTAILPGLGTILGGLVGGFLAGSAASSVSQSTLDLFIEDDNSTSIKVLESELMTLSFDYLLSESEIQVVLVKLQSQNFESKLRDIYASKDRSTQAQSILEPLVIDVVQQRKLISIPSNSLLIAGYENLCNQLIKECALES